MEAQSVSEKAKNEHRGNNYIKPLHPAGLGNKRRRWGWSEPKGLEEGLTELGLRPLRRGYHPAPNTSAARGRGLWDWG